MADITNKTLAAFLLIATIVSMGGFLLTFETLDGLSGRATFDTGNSNFSINSTISVSFTTNAVEFGIGVVNESGAHNCTLNTSGPGMRNGAANPVGGPDCIGFNATLAPLRIQNQGTQNVTLNISFNATGTTFVTGTTPELGFKATTNETGSCGNATSLTFNTAYQAVTLANTNYSICNSTTFGWVPNNRTLNLDLGIRIPQDATPGVKRVTITAFASNP
jgi:hypothetical protein